MDQVYNEMNITDKITLIAEMYYAYGLTQGEIAEKLMISKPWVSKLLNRAIDLGIVRIEVLSHFAGFKELQDDLQKKYGTKIFIVKNPTTGDGVTNIGKAVANYLLARIRPGDTIGVSWGATLSVMIEQLIPMQMRDVTVVPLVGGVGSNAACLSNLAAIKMAEKFGAQCLLFHAQAFCSSKEEKEAILSNPEVRSVIERGNRSDIAFVGVGDLYSSTMVKSGFITEESIKELEKSGAIGDISLWFINQYGQILDHGINQQIVACSLQEVSKNAREVICMASGKQKVRTLDAALKGKWFTSLFTDISTAEELFQYKG